MSVQASLNALSLELPPVRAPGGHYEGFVLVTGPLLFLSGQGADAHKGRVGSELTVEQGRAAARACMLNLLSQASAAVETLDRIRRVVKLLGFVACTEDFNDQPAVLDGASDLLLEVLGARGQHARSAIGVQSLPRGFAVEIEMILAVDDSPDHHGRKQSTND
jgi:enamine deaminase RidA (YjgF/YER057c/UK114 family)